VRLAKPRLAWLWLYVAVNLIGAAMMLSTGELIGDPKGNPVYDAGALLVATGMVVLSYILILGPLFNFLDRIKVEPLRLGDDDDETGRRIGKLLLVLQLGYMAFNLSTGVNIAGAHNEGTNSPFAILWVFIPVDTLCLIYYGVYRENRYFLPNVAVWLVSNLLRGWGGMYLAILFFEWCRATRNGRLKLRSIVIAGTAVIVLYPVVMNLKWLFRLSASGVAMSDIADALLTNAEQLDYFSMIGEGVEHIVGRLQVTSLVVEVMRLSDLLQEKFAAADFMPFWHEGLHGIILDRLFVGEKSLSIGVAFTQYGTFDWDTGALGDWNTNIGYVGWFFIAPHLIPVYLLYTVFVAFLSIYLAKKIGMSELSRDMVWFGWLCYLLPPWFAVFITFIYSLFLFLAIKVLVTRWNRRGKRAVPGRDTAIGPTLGGC
jgi:hypothetical protein